MTSGEDSPPASQSGAKKRFIRATIVSWTVGILIAALFMVVRDVPAPGWRISEVTTGETREYPELQSRTYDSSPENTTIFAAASASRLPRWKVIQTDRESNTVVCEVKTLAGLFTEDITVRVTPDRSDPDASLVQIRARSRTGNADFGRNAEHIRDLQAAMDDKLPRLNP